MGPAFEAASAAANQSSRGFRQAADTQAIDQILNQMGQENGISDQDLMGQVLKTISKENQSPFLNYIQNQQKMKQLEELQRLKNEARAQEEAKKQVLREQEKKQAQDFQRQMQREKEQFQLGKEERKERMKKEEKAETYRGALSTVNRMFELAPDLGRGSGVKSVFGGKTARKKAEFEQLGKSIITFASSVYIRNDKEFQALAGQLMDATQPVAALQGTLDAMKRNLNNTLQSLQAGEEAESEQGQQKGNSKPSLDKILFS